MSDGHRQRCALHRWLVLITTFLLLIAVDGIFTGRPAPVTRAAQASGAALQQASATPPPSLGPNLLKNPGFEFDDGHDGKPDHWGSTLHVARSTATAVGGRFSLRHFSTANNRYSIGQTVTGVRPRTSYQLSAWTNIPPTSDAFSFNVEVVWRDANGATLRRDPLRIHTGATSGWVQDRILTGSPPGTTNAVVRMSVGNLGTTIYVDNVALQEFGPLRSPTPLPPSPTLPPEQENLLRNPGFEQAGSSSWLAADWEIESAQRGQLASREGSSSLELYILGSAAQVVDGITPGQQYELSSWALFPMGLKLEIMLDWLDASGAVISTDLGPSYAEWASGWRWAQRRLTAPSGAVSARVRVDHSGAAVSASLDALVFKPVDASAPTPTEALPTPVGPTPTSIVPVVDNLLQNPSFEAPLEDQYNIPGWPISSVYGVITGTAQHGSLSVYALPSESSAGSYPFSLSQRVAHIRPGERYALSAWLYGPSEGSYELKVIWRGMAGGQQTALRTDLGTFHAFAPYRWSQAGTTVVAPANASEARIILVGSAPGLVDNVVFGPVGGAGSVTPTPSSTPTRSATPSATPSPSPTRTATATSSVTATSCAETCATPTPALGPNLLLNPDFEHDGSGDGKPDHWTTSPYVGLNARVQQHGLRSMWHHPTANNSYVISQAVYGIKQRAAYQLSAWTNIPATADSFLYKVEVVWRNASNATLRRDTLHIYSGPTGGWVRDTILTGSPPGTTNVVVRMNVSNLGTTIYADDFALREAIAAPPTSTPTATPPAPGPDNLLRNPGFEVLGTHDQELVGWDKYGSYRLALVQHEGGHSARICGRCFVAQDVAEIVGGQQYELGAWVMTPLGGPIEVAVGWVDARGEDLRIDTLAPLEGWNNEWRWLGRALTAPPEAVRAWVRVLRQNSGQDAYVDEMLFRRVDGPWSSPTPAPPTPVLPTPTSSIPAVANLLQNASFELTDPSQGDFPGWWLSAFPERIGEVHQHGHHSLFVRYIEDVPEGVRQQVVVTPGQRYAASVWCYSLISSSFGCDLRIDWIDSAGSRIHSNHGSFASFLPFVWSQRGVIAVAPPNAARAQINVLVGGATAVDNVVFGVVGDEPPPPEPTFTALPTRTPTVMASPTPLPPGEGPNLLRNPGFETAGRTISEAFAWATNSRIIWPEPHGGLYSVQLTPANSTAEAIVPKTVTQQISMVEPGRSYKVGAWITSNNGSVRLRVIWRDASDVTIRIDEALTYDRQLESWTYGEGRVTAPAGAATARFEVSNWAPDGAGEVDDVVFSPLDATP